MNFEDVSVDEVSHFISDGESFRTFDQALMYGCINKAIDDSDESNLAENLSAAVEYVFENVGQ